MLIFKFEKDFFTMLFKHRLKIDMDLVFVFLMSSFSSGNSE